MCYGRSLCSFSGSVARSRYEALCLRSPVRWCAKAAVLVLPITMLCCCWPLPQEAKSALRGVKMTGPQTGVSRVPLHARIVPVTRKLRERHAPSLLHSVGLVCLLVCSLPPSELEQAERMIVVSCRTLFSVRSAVWCCAPLI